VRQAWFQMCCVETCSWSSLKVRTVISAVVRETRTLKLDRKPSKTADQPRDCRTKHLEHPTLSCPRILLPATSEYIFGIGIISYNIPNILRLQRNPTKRNPDRLRKPRYRKSTVDRYSIGGASTLAIIFYLPTTSSSMIS
jgi:hypothetical protein